MTTTALDVRTLLPEGTNLIGGEFVPARSGDVIEIKDPSTQEVLARVAHGVQEDVDDAVANAAEAFKTWRSEALRERAFDRVVSRARSQARSRGDGFDEEAYRARLAKQFPLGSIERGEAFSADGILYGCQSAGRRLVRFNADGTTTALAHKLGGLYHNQPKDMAVDQQGRIWFTDPHGNLREAANPQIKDKLDHASVLRMHAPPHQDAPISRMTYDTDAPNALLLSRDGRTLYVAESSEEIQGKRELRAYPILEDDTLGAYSLLHVFGADDNGVHRGVSGMCLDNEGNILACAGWNRSGPGPMIYVFSPQGRVLETHPLPDGTPTNCAFGDASLGTLFVTTSEGLLYRVRNSQRRGWSLYPNTQ
ncbi:MAG: aldehyde dehydrogenase family protein [Chloroflexi bacterium]|nr:aldehyde dehydrogenase family protein [Chloroflexota bacterium]